MKVNLSGQRIRRKSPVHRKIINTSGRRKTDKTRMVNTELIKRRDSWPKNGEFVSGQQRIKRDVRKINQKPNSNIMVLGAGQGAEVTYIKSLLKSKKSNIDTLSISNQLSDAAKAIVRADYSPNKPKVTSKDLFEHFSHLKFVKKYDYVYSAFGPVLHTKYPEISILKVASMLKPGGFARIVPWFSEHKFYDSQLKAINKYLSVTNNVGSLDFNVVDNSLIITRKK